MKEIDIPVKERRIQCEYCGHTMPLMNTPYASNHYRFGFKCCVCKKEGCEECTTWFTYNEVKYLYHGKCEKKLPERVLKAIKAYRKKKDRKDLQHYSDYPLNHIC